MDETTGFSDSSKASRRETKERRMGFVSFNFFHCSCRGESLWRTTDDPALQTHIDCHDQEGIFEDILRISDDATASWT